MQKNKNPDQAEDFQQKQTEIILESISDGVFTVDHNWLVTSFNRAAEEITGISREEAIGKYCWEVFRSNMCESECPLAETMQAGWPVHKNGYIVDRNGRRIQISVSTALLKDERGQVLGGVETFRDISEVEELRKELQEGFQVGDLVSRSKSMYKIFQLLPRVAESESTILIQGETGTGKELLAKAIHHLSSRKDNPFVAINCGALPETLLESELFGYKPGAFTDAKKEKQGQFFLAQGGTILLDEIGETTNTFQVKLLRVLQEREFTPLGGTRPVKLDVRILAASNRDLFELQQQGKFRKDLYYRVNVVSMKLPPLRERKEDIPLLVEHFIKRLNRLHNRNITGISQEALSALMSYEFPGNIRELENIIEYSFVLSASNMIQREDLPEYLNKPNSAALQEQGLKQSLDVMQSQLIMDTLKKNNYNRSKTAKELGMHKSTLYRKMHKLGLDLPKKKPGKQE